MLCCLVWKRAMDMEVLDEAARIYRLAIFGWLALRMLDILFRGALGTAFHFDRFAGVFWTETLLIASGGWLLRRSLKTTKPNYVPGLRAQFAGRYDLPLQPHDIGLPARPGVAVFSVGHRNPGRAGLHLHRHRGLSSRGKATCEFFPLLCRSGTTWRATTRFADPTFAGLDISSTDFSAKTNVLSTESD